jgi:hypothetical protein
VVAAEEDGVVRSTHCDPGGDGGSAIVFGCEAVRWKSIALFKRWFLLA